MLNGRLYRAGWVPVLPALLLAAFSLSHSPQGKSSTQPPQAFDGARAAAELHSLAAEFPDRRPGGEGDRRLAQRVAHTLEGLGGPTGGGFSVTSRHFDAQTTDGTRTLTTVIAQRAGATGAPPIVVVAHRDASARGSEAQLSATAALLELARALAAGETERTIVLVSTSGGSGGDAGAANFVAHARGPFDAAIVLGDLAGARVRHPTVLPFSDGFGSAPVALQRTVTHAVAMQAGSAPGAPSVLGQLAQLAFPITVGEQGELDAGGIPAVLVQVSGDREPSAREPVSAERLEEYGRGVLSAVYALDSAGDVPATMQTGVLVQGQTMPAWAWRLLAASLLIGPLIVAVDWLARLRRRGEPLGRWLLWAPLFALPFFLAALFARLLTASGSLPATSAALILPGSLPTSASVARSTAAVVAVLVLACLLLPAGLRRAGLGPRPQAQAAGLSLVMVLLVLCVVALAVDPFTALLLVPAVHLSLLVACPQLRPRRALALCALALLPLVLLVAFYVHQLALGPGAAVETAVLLAAGHVSVASAALWSLAFGCAAAAAMLAVTPPAKSAGLAAPDRVRITVRGPLSYAGPGSLGGTESALRR